MRLNELVWVCGSDSANLPDTVIDKKDVKFNDALTSAWIIRSGNILYLMPVPVLGIRVIKVFPCNDVVCRLEKAN